MSSKVDRNFAELGSSSLELANMYGVTETSVVCCLGFVGYKEYAADTKGKLIPVGKALPNYQIWVGDSLGRAHPPGWTGDIYVTGSGAIGGYSGSEVDNHRILIHPDTGGSNFWTGDWGFLNEEGVLFVVSRRLDESIKYTGFHFVQLGEVSRAIIDKSMGKVAEAVFALVTERRRYGLQVQAFIVMSDAANAESRQYLLSLFWSLNIRAYMRPTRAVILESMPRTAGGMINHHASRDMRAPEKEVVKVPRCK